MCRCGSAFTAKMLKYSNVFVSLFGVALIIYSITFSAKAQAFGAAGAIPLVLGIIDIGLALTMIFYGSKKMFFLRLYMLVSGLIVLAELVIAILFMVPDTQQQMIAALNLSGDQDLQDWVTNNIDVVGYLFFAMVAVKLVALFFTVFQAGNLYQAFDEDADPLIGNTGYGQRDRKDKLLAKGDKFGALGDEGETNSAAARYKEKNSAFYEKYRIGMKK
jgi:hypothetical protein